MSTSNPYPDYYPTWEDEHEAIRKDILERYSDNYWNDYTPRSASAQQSKTPSQSRWDQEYEPFQKENAPYANSYLDNDYQTHAHTSAIGRDSLSYEKKSQAGETVEARKARVRKEAIAGPPELNEQQIKALDRLIDGKQVFVTGDAGTGKSTLMNRYIYYLENMGIPYIAMAPTGIAALNLKGGRTIHSAMAITPKQVWDPQEKATPSTKYARQKEIDQAEVVIIDEISMVRIDLFDRVVKVLAEAVHRTRMPKRLIVMGDFYQLPPVTPEQDKEVLDYWYENGADGWCFNAACWKRLKFETIHLTKILRQTDAGYLHELNRLRDGDVACLPYFNQRVVEDEAQWPRNAIKLCAKNYDAALINSTRLSEIDGKEYVFKGKYKLSSALEQRYGNNEEKHSQLLDELKSMSFKNDEVVTLKVGARVMSLVNEPCGGTNYRNGSIGVVTSISKNAEGYDSVRVRFDDGIYATFDNSPSDFRNQDEKKRIKIDQSTGRAKEESIGRFIQIPLKLAWAITIHKSQGQTYKQVVVNPNDCFECGHLYVALSRCTNIEGLILSSPIKEENVISSATVQKFYNNLFKTD